MNKLTPENWLSCLAEFTAMAEKADQAEELLAKLLDHPELDLSQEAGSLQDVLGARRKRKASMKSICERMRQRKPAGLPFWANRKFKSLVEKYN